MSKQPLSSRPRQRGMTLVEVLVTVVLISVGLLGIAALQLTSLKNNKEAHVRSQATILAGDILDRMRANARGFRAGEYVVDWDDTGTAGTLSGRDLSDWQAEIDRQLPNAAGRVQRDANNIATIEIRWSERGNDAVGLAADNNVRFMTRSEI